MEYWWPFFNWNTLEAGSIMGSTVSKPMIFVLSYGCKQDYCKNQIPTPPFCVINCIRTKKMICLKNKKEPQVVKKCALKSWCYIKTCKGCHWKHRNRAAINLSKLCLLPWMAREAFHRLQQSASSIERIEAQIYLQFKDFADDAIDTLIWLFFANCLSQNHSKILVPVKMTWKYLWTISSRFVSRSFHQRTYGQNFVGNISTDSFAVTTNNQSINLNN